MFRIPPRAASWVHRHPRPVCIGAVGAAGGVLVGINRLIHLLANQIGPFAGRLELHLGWWVSTHVAIRHLDPAHWVPAADAALLTMVAVALLPGLLFVFGNWRARLLFSATAVSVYVLPGVRTLFGWGWLTDLVIGVVLVSLAFAAIVAIAQSLMGEKIGEVPFFARIPTMRPWFTLRPRPVTETGEEARQLHLLDWAAAAYHFWETGHLAEPATPAPES